MGLICLKLYVKSLVVISTTELVKETLWITGLVRELDVEQGGVRLYCDIQSVIYLENNWVYILSGPSILI